MRSIVVVAALAGLLGRVAESLAVCTHVCREQVAACGRAECAGLESRARHRCMETCRGRLGCPAAIGTLAYVVTRCRVDHGALVGSQELVVRRRNCDPVTVRRFVSADDATDPLGLCAILAGNREGFGSVIGGVFQRIGVTPGGSHVVFEVTNRFQLGSKTPLVPEDEGFFIVRANGTGLRRLGPASRSPSFVVYVRPAGDVTANFVYFIGFTPESRLMAFIDRGPGPTGTDADQVFTMDLATGRRTQVTSLPSAKLPAGRVPVSNPGFLDEDTIVFFAPVLAPAASETSDYRFAIETDGRRLRSLPYARVLEHTPFMPVGTIDVRSPIGRVLTLSVPGKPVNTTTDPELVLIREVFQVRRRDVLQLTNFRRTDTRGIAGVAFGSTVPSNNRQRVLLYASADPLGTNPSQNCQLFSVGVLGEDLRQLTSFSEAPHSANGCNFTGPPGCAFHAVYQDAATGEIVFYSNCSPFGSNPQGSQLFAMKADGTRLRQLTHTAGATFGADGVVEVEIPGPFAYSAAPH